MRILGRQDGVAFAIKVIAITAINPWLERLRKIKDLEVSFWCSLNPNQVIGRTLVVRAKEGTADEINTDSASVGIFIPIPSKYLIK